MGRVCAACYTEVEFWHLAACRAHREAAFGKMHLEANKKRDEARASTAPAGASRDSVSTRDGKHRRCKLHDSGGCAQVQKAQVQMARLVAVRIERDRMRKNTEFLEDGQRQLEA